eukprot:14376091-Alexandrium_andersonii.AAC.1
MQDLGTCSIAVNWFRAVVVAYGLPPARGRPVRGRSVARGRLGDPGEGAARQGHALEVGQFCD